MSYSHLPTNEGDLNAGGISGTEPTRPPSSSSRQDSGGLILKILYKEQPFEVNDPSLSTASTVAELKAVIARESEIPVSRQRLIFCGKSLKPDGSTLRSFKITNGACIHLFPLPEVIADEVARAQPVTNVMGNCMVTIPSSSNRNTDRANRQSYVGILDSQGVFSHHSEELQNPMHFDASIQISSGEVRGWCYLLIFTSTTTLMNNFTLVMSKGILGHGALDSIVNIIESCLAIVGLYIAMLGLKSCQTLDVDLIRRYSYMLCILGIASALEKCLWVFDIVHEVESEVGDADVSNFILNMRV